MLDIFISGCALRIPLKQLQPLEFSSLTFCSSKLLRNVDNLQLAIKACDSCKYKNHVVYIEPGFCVDEAAQNDIPLIDTLGLESDSELKKTLLEIDIPEVYTRSYNVVVEPCIDLPEIPVEKRRAKIPMVPANSHYISTRLAPLPIYADFDDGSYSKYNLERLYLEYGSVPTIMGSTCIKTAYHCLRKFFYERVLGLRKILLDMQEEVVNVETRQLQGVEVSSLAHICYTEHVKTGGRFTWEPLYKIRHLYPESALEVKALIDAHFERNSIRDRLSADFRAVEQESWYLCNSRKVRGQDIVLPLTSRHDILFHRLLRGESRKAVGEQCSSIYIRDLKFYKGLPSNISGIRLNAQTTLHLFTSRFGHAKIGDQLVEESVQDIYGPIHGIQYDYLSKTGKHHGKRFEFNESDNMLAYRIAALEDFLYQEVADRLLYDKWQDKETWPCSFQCADVYYIGWLCPFYMLCGNQSNFSGLFEPAKDLLLVTPETLFWKGKLVSLQKMLKKGRIFSAASKALEIKLT